MTTIQTLALDAIRPNPDQPRKSFEGIEDLAESLISHGLLQPISVRPVDQGYIIIAGERRYRAATVAGWDKIDAIIHDVDENTAYQLAVLENIARKDMNPIEEARAVRKLCELGMSYSEIEKAVGWGDSKGRFAQQKELVLDCIPEIQFLVERGQVLEIRARQMSRLSRNGQLKCLQIMNSKPMTTREFSILTDTMVAKENQQEMFVETKVPEEVTQSVDKFTKLLDDVATAATRLENLNPQHLGLALHRTDQLAARIDQVMTMLIRARRVLNTETGRQEALGVE